MLNSLLKRALGLERTVIEGARIEGDSIIVSVRPRRAAPRCPVCGRRCAAYDRLGPRRWRAPDLGAARCYLEHAPVRASCPEHGVRTAPVPWARCASSRFASAFEDWVAWLALHMCRSALAELARVDWHTVGGICARVEASLEEADGRGRLDGLRRIGVDETSYKKGQRYMTVVVDHDRGRVVWACRGHGKDRLNEFLDLLTDEQREAIEVVTADGARWIADAVADLLAEEHVPVVSGPYMTDRSKPEIRNLSDAAPGLLCKAGIETAITVDHPEIPLRLLPMALMLAVRAGMDKTDALRAVTSVPAKIAGMQDRIGSLKTGLDADCVLWSGDPLDIATQVQAVFVNGTPEYRRTK